MAKRNTREYKKYRQRKLKGTSLLLRIQAITGSTNLDNFNGSIKKLAIDCGYVPDEYTYMPITESIKKKIKQFVYEYHQANKTNSPKSSKLVLIDDDKLDKLLSYSKPKSASQKKFEKLLKTEIDKPAHEIHHKEELSS